jgi:hypothetical protein
MQRKKWRFVQGNPNPNNDIYKVCKGKGKGKVYSRTGHEGPEGE